LKTRLTRASQSLHQLWCNVVNGVKQSFADCLVQLKKLKNFTRNQSSFRSTFQRITSLGTELKNLKFQEVKQKLIIKLKVWRANFRIKKLLFFLVLFGSIGTAGVYFYNNFNLL